MQSFLFFLALLSLGFAAQAACPKNKKEWQAKGPKLLIEKASRQAAPIEIPDFSKKLGKNAIGKASPYKDRKGEFALVEAQDKDSSLFLSGLLKCDPEKKEPVLLSLTYVKGAQSGFIKVTNQ